MKKLIIGSLLTLLVMVTAGVGGLFLMRAEQPATTLGAVSGPDQNNSLSYSWNGLRIYPSQMKMQTATTTVCSFKSPNATTTLRYFTADFVTSTTTASTVYLAKGANSNATTTNFESYARAANTLVTIMASSTARTNGLPIIAPNTFLNVGISGGTGTFSPIGTCTLELNGV